MKPVLLLMMAPFALGGCFFTARSHEHAVPAGSPLEAEVRAIDPSADRLVFRESRGNPNIVFWHSSQHGDQICVATAGAVVHTWQTSTFLQGAPFCAPNVGQQP